ncbi:MAG: hypothetical protein SGJ15_11870 [Bacteroidota bacterium]|nr:hypothetical protein [Bacteroidota bacterium]
MKRFKIIKNREALSSQEINKQMDFGKFITAHTPVNSFLSAKIWLLGGAGAITVAAIAFAVMTMTNGEDPKKLSKESTRAFVAPPLPKMTIEPNTNTISGNADTVINYASGAKVFIPANSFVDKDNKPVTGPYTIHFREFRDQFDQLLSGIPMEYDSAGTKYQFESAGMFEIDGTKDGEKIFIAEGKEIAVDMPSTDLNNKFNVYYLDTVAKNWSYDKNNSLNSRTLIAGIDSLLHQKYHTGVKSIVVPKEADPNLDNLVIDFNKDEFPELAIFKGIKFEFIDRKTKASEGVNNTWEDVSVSRKEKGRYLVEFTKGDVSKSFITVPVLEKAELEKTFAEYDHIRIRRMAKLKNISDSITNLRGKYEKEHELSKNANEAITKMVSEGKFLSALNDYVDLESVKLLTRSGTITRTALIRRFGIYNFDAMASLSTLWEDVIKREVKKTIVAHYYFGNKRIESEIDNAYLIKRDFNGIFKLDWKEIFDFPVTSGSNADILIVVTKNKQFYYIKDEEFKAIDFNAKDIAFNLKGAPVTVKTPGALREFLEL